jgi:hypothetical protein
MEHGSLDGVQELQDYFRSRPLDLHDWHELPEAWMFFVHDYLNEDNLSRLAAYLHKDASEIDENDFNELPQTAHDFFIDWLDDRGFLREWRYHDPASCPAWVFIDPIGPVPSQTWLIHFTDHADAIVAQGFTRGIEDINAMALTHQEGIRVNDSELPGYNFGFMCDGSIDVEGRALQAAQGSYYGKQAVLFQAPGLRVHHSGDREEQVIFWGPNAHNIHKLDRAQDRWVLDGKRSYAKVANALKALK